MDRPSAHETRQAQSRRMELKGPLAWMARNSVAANLLMLVLIIGGLFMSCQIKQEVFPEVDLDIVTISVAYPGASPEEVEQAVILAVEESVRGIDGVKEVRSNASEGGGSVAIELLIGTDANVALADVKSAVDRITSFPGDVERPVISIATNRNRVLTLVLYGDFEKFTDAEEASLRELAEQARMDLIDDPRVTVAELGLSRPPEISVEITQENLRKYNLTTEQVAQAIRAASVELPSGSVKTERGEILLRTTERRERGSEFENIIITSDTDGRLVRLKDVANVVDGFRETDHSVQFDGKPAAMVDVYRVGDETPMEVSQAVKDYIAKKEAELPEGLDITYWGDRSEMYGERVDLLQRNATLGLILVLIVLGLFLEIRLAFWVTLGIPISFIGTLLFMPTLDVSINMISLFAFIVTLGIVVDDAIVVGEAVYTRRQQGFGAVQAAVAGLRDVAMPVVFSVLTTVIAFSPMLFVPGTSGKFFRVIPLIAITVLLLSLVESLLILPAHLAHSSEPKKTGFFAFIRRQQMRFSTGLEYVIERAYGPMVRTAVRHRSITLAASIAMLIPSCALLPSGALKFTFMPKIEADNISAELYMPYGTPVDTTAIGLKRIIQAGNDTLDEFGGQETSRGLFTQVGEVSAQSGPRASVSTSGSHAAQAIMILVPAGEREFTASQFAARWRERVEELGGIPGKDSLLFAYETGASGGGAPIDIELSHADMAVLEHAASELATKITEFNGVTDVESGFSSGKMQLDFELTEEARSLGVTEASLARQLRSNFFGAEASRQQRGRDELRTYVRLPRTERSSLYDLQSMMVRTPAGGEIPLSRAAVVTEGQSFTTIRRVDGRRIVSVTADVVAGQANASEVVQSVLRDVLPDLEARYPSLTHSLGGQQQQQDETLGALKVGAIIALIVMFALMAIPFRSYVQPLIIILGAIPFGFIGASVGHLLMGYDLSLLSVMGLVALSGVVVNDSLVMITTINENRDLGMSTYDAVIGGAQRRFRPILLTSLTTFFGLAPMILETSVQARFLIPMAISLGFGILFATGIILLLVPSVYMLVEDIRVFFGGGQSPDASSPGSSSDAAHAPAE